MKNKEKYFDEIVQSFTDKDAMCGFKRKHILKTENCWSMLCSDCHEIVKKWLEQEYQEPITLTDDEKVILKNVDNIYKWVARDRDGSLCVYDEKPRRTSFSGEWVAHGISTIDAFKHLFKLIKWADEPYNIDELLKQNGAERNEE